MEEQGILRQTRRQIIKTAIGAAGFVLTAPALRLAAAVQAGNTTEKLADDMYVIRMPGEAAVVVQTGANSTMMVDGGSAAGSDAILKAVAALPGAGPVRTLFNTHWHPEQTGSNEKLGMAGATIIAQENTRLWLTQNVTWPYDIKNKTARKLPKIAQPNKTFYETAKLDSGIRYGYVADAPHTNGDMYVFFPKQNVLAVGDAVNGAGWAEMDWWTGGWIGGVVGGLQRLQSVCDANTRIVPARGPALTVADLKSQTDMYGAIYDRLNQMLNKGRGPSEAVAANPTKEFDAKMGNPDAFVRRAFESLWAYLSPDA